MPSVHAGAIVASVIPSAPLGTDAAAGLPGLGAAAAVASDKAPAERRFRFELAAHPGSPAQARRLTRARLTGWSVCEDICDSAALVVTELVTNAIVHTASSHIVCELHDGDELVRIAVRDEGCAPGEPRPSTQRGEEEHGRGLLLVDALCHAWGAHEHGFGLLVWAELPRKADAPRHDCGPCNDLGWGARPKPGPAGGSEDQGDEADARHGGLAAPHEGATARHDGTARHDTDTPHHGTDAPHDGVASRHDGTTRHEEAAHHGEADIRHHGEADAHHQGEPDTRGHHIEADTRGHHTERPHDTPRAHDTARAPEAARTHDDTTACHHDLARLHDPERHHGTARHHGTGGPWL